MIKDNNEQQISPESLPDNSQEDLTSLSIPLAITVHDLAEIMGIGAVEIIKELMRNSHMVTINDVIEYDLAKLVAANFGYEVQPATNRTDQSRFSISPMEEDDETQLEPRPPVVTILGHVDHGKTTLLDTIRKSKVTDGEAGGITQHIGAYQISYNENSITFIDTPGHAAFTAMRARGAQVTDIVVLVIAADDGIMPQTLEAIDHAKAAHVPIIVAITKVDKPDADIERVKRQLGEQNLIIEEWGGDIIAVPLSGLSGEGVPDLLENILLIAEVAELKANPNKLGEGIVIEARIDKTKGNTATVLIQIGTLNVGDNIVLRDTKGKIKALVNDQGKRVEKAQPSEPVEILGIDSLPDVGDRFFATTDDKTARRILDEHIRDNERQKATGNMLKDAYSRIESGETKALDLIVKTDVQGTIDAIRVSLERLNSEQTKVNIVHASSGNITESDVMLAIASQATIIGFNSMPETGASTLANSENVEIRHYNIIYNLTDDIEKALTGLLTPVSKDIIEGHATVREIFNIGKRTKVAGIYVNDGRITRNSTVHLHRSGKVLFVGQLSSLKHFKNDVREITASFEGGVVLDGFVDYQTGDVLEIHTEQID